MDQIQLNEKKKRDEHLEGLWHFKEEGKDSVEELQKTLGGDFSVEIVEELLSDGLIKFNADRTKITLTGKGGEYARQIIRAHRIAERMMHDCLGRHDELAACEFEHTIATGLVDSICILLGHPRECPHGKPIPQGECCKASVKTIKSTMTPLTELEVGQSGRVAYVRSQGDQQLHKIDGLHIKPGAVVKLQKVYPTYVIECEDASVALDSALAANICVWKEPTAARPTSEKPSEPKDEGKKGPRRNFWSGMMGRR